MILTIRQTNLLDAMTLAGWSKQKLEFIQQNSRMTAKGMWTGIAFGIVHLLFLLWLGRYFRPAKPERSAEASPEARL